MGARCRALGYLKSAGRGTLSSLGITCIVVSGLAVGGSLGGPGGLHRRSGPATSSGGEASLVAVSCVSGSWCTAVGHSGTRTFVESWDGKTWAVVPSPGTGQGTASLDGVSCTSARSCIAVGSWSSSNNAGSAVRALVESWDGKTWAVVPSPGTGQGTASLDGVSCTSARSCIAVGSWSSSSNAGSAVRALVESWDGMRWSVTPGPSLAPAPAALNGITCASARSCTAVGNDGSATLAELWNGATWSVVHSPTPGTYGGLSGVSCASAASCTAVGNFSYGTGSGSSILPRALVESWHGRSWSVVPLSGPSVAHLYGVSCTARSCQAVGDYANASGLARSLAESWNGSTWSLVPTPGLPTAYLYGVTCTTARFCVAVGQYSNSVSGPSPMDALTEYWDGTAWLPSPS